MNDFKTISTREMIARITQNDGRLMIERDPGSQSAARFLFEDGTAPKVGEVYSDLTIGAFKLDHTTFDFVLDATVRMAEKYRTIEVRADILDESRHGVEFETPKAEVHDVSSFNYHREGNLKAVFGGEAADRAAVLVYLDLTDEAGIKTHAVKLKYEAGLEVIHEVVHPKKQPRCLRFGNGENPPRPFERGGLRDDDFVFQKDADVVAVALLRKPDRLLDLDYLCDFGRETPYGKPMLAIPIKGSLRLLQASKIVSSGSRKPFVYCTIAEEGKNGVRVAAVSGFDYDTRTGCQVSGNTLNYDLTEYSWQEVFREPSSRTPIKYIYTIEFSLYYTLSSGTEIHLTPSYSSGGVLNSGSDEKLPYIALAWGCLAADSEILMADGSRRMIADISAGDYVSSGSGEKACVKNVWRGTDSNCYVIKSERGDSVTATFNHPFPTKDGWKCPPEIRKGDTVFGWFGEKLLVAEVAKAEGCFEIVNLEFDQPTVIVANGFQTGDYSIQNGKFPE